MLESKSSLIEIIKSVLKTDYPCGLKLWLMFFCHCPFGGKSLKRLNVILDCTCMFQFKITQGATVHVAYIKGSYTFLT